MKNKSGWESKRRKKTFGFGKVPNNWQTLFPAKRDTFTERHDRHNYRHIAVTMAVSIFGNFCEFICKF